jgi:hypothetical protein
MNSRNSIVACVFRGFCGSRVLAGGQIRHNTYTALVTKRREEIDAFSNAAPEESVFRAR